MKMKKTTAIAALMLGVLAAIFSSNVGVCAAEVSDGSVSAALPSDVKVSSRIIEFLFGKGRDDSDKKSEEKKGEAQAQLCPGGDIFGVIFAVAV